MTPERYDDLLIKLAQDHNGIEPLLSTFFSFLHRKTDFFVEMDPHQPSNMGFLPGKAKEMLLKSFDKFPMKPAPASPSMPQKAATSTPVRIKEKAPLIQYTEDGKLQIPIGNGGITSQYSWTQSLDEVTVSIPLPVGTKSRDIQCTFGCTDLRVHVGSKVDEPNASSPVDVQGKLYAKIKSNESLWSLESSGSSSPTLVISLEKVTATWWKTVLQGDSEIDTTKVDSTMKIHEYDESTQAAIRKVMFDQNQKAKGLPTSEELTQHAILEKAQHLPGSPFL